ncbi:Uncharacterized protein LARI1_G004436 [Lachnellula arida]|uniref:PhoD-like phosphatase domain-containing protein n=1 Tax=Lachnellula arida TaxID=1316785 RepID=A0A8T9BEX2_9HELO|nr:Uncharacterized protein LARI1_G004436 [Lachnellula arida]
MSTAPYWGQLPPPKVTRGNSLKRERDPNMAGSSDLHIDTGVKPERLSGQSRHNRSSIQTEAATISTQSPFASPTTSSFRGDGLAPRPPSFPYSAAATSYNNDYLDKRRGRESRHKDDYYEEDPSAPPPAAPEVPRPGPPVSYKQPFSNGASSNPQAPNRTTSRRRSEGPISPGQDVPEGYYRSHPREDNSSVDATTSKRPSNGKAAVRSGDDEFSTRRASRAETSNQKRKGSTSEAGARDREWAPDKSPLQRLELTLDGITKEEKRARVEEAELLAREAKAGRGGERVGNQNSVRFRNRPVTKGEPGVKPEPQTLPEAGLVRNLSVKQKDQLQRSGAVERERPVPSDAPQTSARDFEYQRKQDTIDLGPTQDKAATPRRGSSVRDRSYIPVAAVAAGAAVASKLGRSGSNKLKKEPPGDPWMRQRMEAEEQYQEVTHRRPSTSNAEPNDGGPSRDTAFRSHPQPAVDKELPTLPTEASRPSDYLDSDSAEETDIKPVRRETLSKTERLTGQTLPAQVSRPIQPARPEVKVNGAKYGVATEVPAPQRSAHHEVHHLPDVFHRRHDSAPGQGVYIPSGRLDEWKTGGVALLSGSLLDLEAEEQIEIEKDKTWWEAGHTGKRRRSSATRQRKAEAYDGEYDDSNGKDLRNSRSALEGRGRISRTTKNTTPPGVSKPLQPFSVRPWIVAALFPFRFSILSNIKSAKISKSKPHSLTCPTRAIRVRPDIVPTRFKPPLFLRSGPLLRYCGLRREKLTGRLQRTTGKIEREVWRGSIMIVTQDDHSSYELAPTLRLFLQPTDLLPPPPAQVGGEELASEYVDPIAGLPKIGRDGRTLYIRPVEHLEEEKDLSREESDEGLFEMQRSPLDGASERRSPKPHYDGEKAGKYKEVRGFRLHTEHGVTFWRFNIEIELRENQQRIAYRINRGPATGFWVPPRGQPMNIMFQSCNGFSSDVNPNDFCGPDPMWRDVLNTHQTQPIHVMLGGGDQIYNDAVMEETSILRDWDEMKNGHRKESMPFSPELQTELESFYLNRYCMWFSQGLFGLAVSQIPMVNIFDDHDIIDGYGSYPDPLMRSPIMSGLGAIAFKYYMLFQHQSSIDEGEESEPSWILGTEPGHYIGELSRSIFTSLGGGIDFLGLDCRTERMNDEIVSAETYHKVFDRLEKEIIYGKTKHLIVLVGVPVAYPRMVWLENILTSRAIEPIKALGRTGLLGKKLLNHLDGGVEILDDLDDHWTARHHKEERNWFIQELQDLAAEKSVRITILGGDVHLGAIGQFYSNPKHGIPKDRDHRYMPNVISSAIVNTPPPDTLADILNRRNKVHHLDADTDEDMIPIFTHDTNGKSRNNKRLLNRRNWCSIKLYNPELSPPPTPETNRSPGSPPQKMSLLRRLSSSRGLGYRPDVSAPSLSKAPPLSSAGFFNRRPSTSHRASTDSQRPGVLTRTLSLTRKDFTPGNLFRKSSKRRQDSGGINGYEDDTEDDDSQYQQSTGEPRMRGGSGGRDDSYFPDMDSPTGRVPAHPVDQASTSIAGNTPHIGPPPRTQFHRTPTGLSARQINRPRNRPVNLEGGLDICLNMEVSQKDPAGITMPYRLLVPALWYEEETPGEAAEQVQAGMKRWMSFSKKKGKGPRG